MRVFSQPIILYQGNNEMLNLYDLKTMTFHRLDSNAFGKLVGYQLKTDSLKCFFEIRGNITTKLYVHSLLSKVIPYPIQMNPSYEFTHARTRQFNFDDFQLLINGHWLKLLKNDQLIWSTTESAQIDSSIYSFLFGYSYPQISPLYDDILVESIDSRMFTGGHNQLYEFDFKTGTRKSIAKGKNASYSSDGHYILYRDNFYVYFYVRDRFTNKNIDVLNGAISAFWIYR